MAWPGHGWKFWVLAGLTLMVVGVGILALLIRAGLPEEPNVVYGEAAGKPLLLDIYRPRGPNKPRPAVLLIHGGGWAEGDKSTMRELARRLTGAGYVAIAVGYRLSKDDASRYPAQVDDVRLAARWVRANADRLGVDPDRLGALGQSAGGHLAAILGTTEAKGTGVAALAEISSRVNCVVDLCGPSDFTDDSNPPVGPAIAWMVPNLFGKTRQEAPEAYRDASPVTHVDARSAPTLIVHGTDDDIVPIDQSRRLRDALERAKVEVKLVELPGEGHMIRTEENTEKTFRETMDFLRRHLKP